MKDTLIPTKAEDYEPAIPQDPKLLKRQVDEMLFNLQPEDEQMKPLPFNYDVSNLPSPHASEHKSGGTDAIKLTKKPTKPVEYMPEDAMAKEKLAKELVGVPVKGWTDMTGYNPVKKKCCCAIKIEGSKGRMKKGKPILFNEYVPMRDMINGYVIDCPVHGKTSRANR